jgi:hypothetical protein
MLMTIDVVRDNESNKSHASGSDIPMNLGLQLLQWFREACVRSCAQYQLSI